MTSQTSFCFTYHISCRSESLVSSHVFVFWGKQEHSTFIKFAQ